MVRVGPLSLLPGFYHSGRDRGDAGPHGAAELVSAPPLSLRPREVLPCRGGRGERGKGEDDLGISF